MLAIGLAGVQLGVQVLFRFVPVTMERNAAPHPTDLRKWKLEVCEGRQVWRYNGSTDQGAADVQTVVDKYLLGLDTVNAIYIF